jgi:hypothetical protein
VALLATSLSRSVLRRSTSGVRVTLVHIAKLFRIAY